MLLSYHSVLVMALLSILNIEVDSRYGESLYHSMRQEDYDKDLRPNHHGAPVNVSVFMFVTSIHSLSEVSMDYGVTLFLSLHWGDPRLAFNSTETIDLRSDSELISKIWMPDLYFVNVKDGALHEVTITNKHIRIHPNGHVLYDLRVSLTLICHLFLHRFPMDKQTCGIKLESFGYTTRDMQLFWDENVTVLLAPELVMPEFSIGAPIANKTVPFYPGLGHYDQLECKFPLSRELIFYLMEYYVPSFLLVVLSWVSFWLNIEASPARASLGITTALTLTTLSSAARAHMAKVSYTKAIDIWMLTCSVFVFAALLEFAMSSYVHTRGQTLSRKLKSKEMAARKCRHKAQLKSNEFTIDESRALTIEMMTSDSDGTIKVGYSRNPETMFRFSRKIDLYSRGIFPFIFLLFNLIYWPTYLRNSSSF
ncbi:glycine receptor subunit alpha-1-like [Ptychodera flava]|uniref:glycine receptor subunit alpha-1-like n=1 Tax=Ptychodera flava TaxID=63121 RepID=UPI00396A4F77